MFCRMSVQHQEFEEINLEPGDVHRAEINLNNKANTLVIIMTREKLTRPFFRRLKDGGISG